MTKLPPPLGHIEIRDVLEFYDQPVLFLASNERDERFLVVLSDEHDQSRIWLFAPLSLARERSVRERRLDLYSAFKLAEGGYVWRVVEARASPSAFTSSPILASTLPDSDVPAIGVLADIPAVSSVLAPNAKALATQNHCDVLMLRLIPKNREKHEVAATRLSRAVSGLQDSVHALGQVRLAKGTKRASIAGKVLDATRLLAVAHHPGSFALELHAQEGADLYGESSISPVIDDLLSILARIDDDSIMRDRLGELQGSRVPSKIKALLLSLSEEMPELEVTWGSPSVHRPVRTVLLDLKKAGAGVRTISNVTAAEPIEFDAIGLLEAGDYSSKFFKFFDEEEQSTYVGRVADQCDIAGATIHGRYTATIRETQEVEPTGDARVRHTLLRLEPLLAVDGDGAPTEVKGSH